MQAYSVLNSIPYVIFFFYLMIIFLEERNLVFKRKSTWNIQILVSCSVFIFIGFRGFVYTDWINYYDAYQHFPSLNNLNFEQPYNNWEIGFIIYSVLLKALGFDYWGWNIISTLIDILILHHFFKKKFYGYYTLAFIAFYLYSGLGIEINLMRNSKAIMLFILSITYLEKRKTLQYLLLNLLGFFFHYTSILYLALYFFLNWKLSKKIYSTIFIIGNVIYLFNIHFLTSFISLIANSIGGRSLLLLNYMENNVSNGITIGYIERLSFFILIYYLYNKLQKEGKQIYLNLYIIYIIFCFFFSEFTVISDRSSLLFIISYWFLIPTIYSSLSIKAKRIFLLLLFIYGTLKVISANQSIVCKYDNLLFGIEQYENRINIFNRYYSE